MSPLDLALDAAVVAWVLVRQRRVRRVRLHFGGRVPVVISLLGLFQFVHYTETHSLGAAVSAVVIGSVVLGAGVLGALRALTVRLSTVGRGALVQQATPATFGAWVVSLGQHFALAAAVAALGGPIGAVAASAVLYVAISLGVQNTVVHHRAIRRLMAGGAVPATRAEAVDARSWEEPGAERRSG